MPPRGRKRKRPCDEHAKEEEDESNTVINVTEEDNTHLVTVATVENGNKSDNEEEFIEVELDDVPSTSYETMTEKATSVNESKSPSKRKAPPAKRGRKSANSVPILSEGSKPEPSSPIKTRAAAFQEKVMLEMKNEDSFEETECRCHLCEMTLMSELELFEHKRAYHKEQVTKADVLSGSLLCAHPHCNGSFPNINHLIAHLVAFHNQQQYRVRRIQFDRIDKFDGWRKELERSSRCSFIASQEPAGSADSYTIHMFCEFCEDWRNQAEKGPSHPQQVPNKIIGCPSYFIASVDNKKDKVSVVGCFAHLGHHKKPSWSAIPCDAYVAAKDDQQYSVTSVKCSKCEAVFRSRTAASRHHRRVHEGILDGRSSEPKMPSLECGDPECDVVCDSMVTLVQHVAEAHNRDDLTVEEYKFNNMEEFESWKLRMEVETCSRFAKISGRDMKHEATKYFLCHLSGHTNRLRRKADSNVHRQRNRPTKKLGRYCTAFMSLKLNKDDKTVAIRGCLGHFGHSFDVRRLPLTDVLKKEITELLLKGCSEDDVVQIVRNRYSEHERGYWLQRYEVRNVTLKLQKEGTYVKEMFAPVDEEREWEESLAVPQYLTGGQETAQYTEQTYIREDDQRAIAMPGMSVDMRFKQGRSLSDIHLTRRRGFSQSQRHRIVGGPTKIKRDILPHGMDLVEYGEYTADGEIVDVREVDGMLEANNDVYYDTSYEEEEKVVTLPHHTVSSPAAPLQLARKRVPLLKEPGVTGNADFDDLMNRIKDRIDNISQQLKVTQDVPRAQELLRELKSLEGRLVSGGVGQTTVPTILQPQSQSWDVEVAEDFYQDYDDQDVDHEVELQLHDMADG
ncbi:unnamed protein product [Auanema sp. JU1783]|nr:unnamed protein product [Auanema sp. JU1783]